MKSFISALFVAGALASDAEMRPSSLTLGSHRLHGNGRSRKLARPQPQQRSYGSRQEDNPWSNDNNNPYEQQSAPSQRRSTRSSAGPARPRYVPSTSRRPSRSSASQSHSLGQRLSQSHGQGGYTSPSSISPLIGAASSRSSTSGYGDSQQRFEQPETRGFSKTKADKVEEDVEELEDEMTEMKIKMAYLEAEVYNMLNKEPEPEKEACMPIMDIYMVNEDMMEMDGDMANSHEGKMPREMKGFKGDIKIDPMMDEICVPAGHTVEIHAQVSVETSPEMGFDMNEGAEVIMSLTKDGFPSYARTRQRVVGEQQSMSLHYGEYVHEDTTFKMLMMQNSSMPDAMMMVMEKEAQMNVKIWPDCHPVMYEAPEDCPRQGPSYDQFGY